MNSHILLFCKETNPYSRLISTLAKRYLVAVSCDVDEFCRYIKKRKYDLVLLEIPESEELFLKAVKEIVSLEAKPPIILIGGNGSESATAEAFRLGVCDYFPKPVDFELLVERVDAILKTK